MNTADMTAKMAAGNGFIAALDQSGGSTPKALAGYGVGEDAWTNEAEMFDLIHAMRERIITSPAFDGSKVIGAILFERTMDGTAGGKPVPAALIGWIAGEVMAGDATPVQTAGFVVALRAKGETPAEEGAPAAPAGKWATVVKTAADAAEALKGVQKVKSPDGNYYYTVRDSSNGYDFVDSLLFGAGSASHPVISNAAFRRDDGVDERPHDRPREGVRGRRPAARLRRDLPDGVRVPPAHRGDSRLTQ